MKRLAVLVMMMAIAAFVPAAMASADDHDGWGIHGEYAMIAAGACLHSTLGFNADLTPVTGSVVWGAPVMTEGTWTFEHHGAGVATLTNHIITLPPGNPAGTPPTLVGVHQTVSTAVPFTYQITPYGEITVQLGGLPINMAGMVSMDRKTLTLGSANQIQPASGAYAICNVDRVLIRVGESEGRMEHR
jgi:hypothetical protein